MSDATASDTLYGSLVKHVRQQLVIRYSVRSVPGKSLEMRAHVFGPTSVAFGGNHGIAHYSVTFTLALNGDLDFRSSWEIMEHPRAAELDALLTLWSGRHQGWRSPEAFAGFIECDLGNAAEYSYPLARSSHHFQLLNGLVLGDLDARVEKISKERNRDDVLGETTRGLLTLRRRFGAFVTQSAIEMASVL